MLAGTSQSTATDRICDLFAQGEPQAALTEYNAAGGAFFAFRHGYDALGRVLDAMPSDLWTQQEAVLGGLVFFLVKKGRAGRARAYVNATALSFPKTAMFDLYDLLVAIHLGEPVSAAQIEHWLQLERRLPISDPLPEGLFHNSMLVMFVRLGRLSEAQTAGRRAISCYREAGNVYLEHFIHLHLADLDVLEGRLRSARRSLVAAEDCLRRAGVHYGNERDLVEIVRLAIDYEQGRITHIPDRASALRSSLLSGDSWAELFVQLGRISVMSVYFLHGHRHALDELERFQADYARRHGGSSVALDLLMVVIDRLDWRPQDALRTLDTLAGEPLQSAIGTVLDIDQRSALGQAALPHQLSGPRAAILSALHQAEATSGDKRRRLVERALRLALDEGQIAPLLEHRDVFDGLGTYLSSGRFARGHRTLARLTDHVLKTIRQSQVIPRGLAELGVTHRQYRVFSALQDGATNKQIARQLGIAEATVKHHLTGLFRLSGTASRKELIVFAEDNYLFTFY